MTLAPARASHEQDCLSYLEDSYPLLVEPFLQELETARSATLELLVLGLLREGLAPVQGKLARLGRATVQVSEFGFGRFQLQSPVSAAGFKLQAASQLIELLEDETPFYLWDRLAKELDNGACNLALARAFAVSKRDQLRPFGYRDYFEYVLDQKRKQPTLDRALLSESLCIDGHNLHPCAKTRLDLDPEALVAGSAEMVGRPRLGLLSAEPWLVRSSGLEPAQLMGQVFGPLPVETGRIPLPVHQWQAETVLPRLGHELAQGVLRRENWSQECRSLASFRTVAVSPSHRLKVSVSSQMTSTQRCISPQTVLNGPRVSALMEQLSPQIGHRFVPLPELGGLCLQTHEDQERLLNCLVRAGLEPFLEDDEVPVTACSLTANSPVGVGSLLEQAARPDPLGFLKAYAELVIPPHLTLLSAFGLTLEAHLQNCIVTFKKRQPYRLFVRDWGGIRLYRPRLEERGFSLELEPGSVTEAKSLEAARDKLYYCLFQAHIGEVVFHLVRRFGLKEARCWNPIQTVIDTTFDRLEGGARPEWARADRQALAQPTLRHKALTLMRLHPEPGDRYVRVKNPLAGQDYL